MREEDGSSDETMGGIQAASLCTNVKVKYLPQDLWIKRYNESEESGERFDVTFNTVNVEIFAQNIFCAHFAQGIRCVKI